MRKLVLFFPIALNLGCPKNPAPAEAPETDNAAQAEPAIVSADELFERFVEVTGGEDAYQTLQNYRVTGYMEVAAQGMKGSVSMYMAEPNLRSQTVEIPGMGQIVRAFDGTHGWEINPMIGPRLLADEELANERLDSTFNASLVWEEVYPQRENQGAAEFAGQDCWKVVAQTAAGNERTIFFGQESGLMYGIEMTMPSDMGPVPVSSRIEDYQQVSGILMPMRTVQTVGPIEMVVQIDNVELNVEDPPDMTMPDAVKALLPSTEEAPADGEETPAAPVEATE